MKAMPVTGVAMPAESIATWRADFFVLVKARLSALVLFTTLAGFLLAAGGAWDAVLLLHTLLGTALVAGGAAALNQAMEGEADRAMRRTKDRPVAAGRMEARSATWLGALLSAGGLIYLWAGAHRGAALVAAITLAVYVLAYTPLKRMSGTCTLIGAVAGALPPLIGWVAAGGGMDGGAWVLFALLFFWQLPHFLAINWLYREEYENAGFVMWSNGDKDGKRTGRLALAFSAALLLATASGPWCGVGGWVYGAGALLAGGTLLHLAWAFARHRERSSAKKLFFGTLIYLPVMLLLLVLGQSLP